MPAQGYTAIFENMLDQPRLSLELGVEFEDVRDEAVFERLVFTGPIDEYFDHRFGKLPYRSLRFRHETLDREWAQPVAVINHPDEALALDTPTSTSSDASSPTATATWTRSQDRLSPHSAGSPRTDHSRLATCAAPGHHRGLLAFAAPNPQGARTGGAMSHDPEHARRLAQNLVELLAPYEEELIALERATPAVGALRRAVGIVIAEACYCISDRPASQEDWAPPTDDQASRAR
ncbi:UDP-galactopyranose mutase [Phenylobacterium sp.]|uniref:UDP-galactopyranose mutase n=1 Tax=Phenylobacterium sp. TaxID=1871053 RepID=UPI003962166F